LTTAERRLIPCVAITSRIYETMLARIHVKRSTRRTHGTNQIGILVDLATSTGNAILEEKGGTEGGVR
jgi:hypothetical protein